MGAPAGRGLLRARRMPARWTGWFYRRWPWTVRPGWPELPPLSWRPWSRASRVTAWRWRARRWPRAWPWSPVACRRKPRPSTARRRACPTRCSASRHRHRACRGAAATGSCRGPTQLPSCGASRDGQRPAWGAWRTWPEPRAALRRASRPLRTPQAPGTGSPPRRTRPRGSPWTGNRQRGNHRPPTAAGPARSRIRTSHGGRGGTVPHSPGRWCAARHRVRGPRCRRAHRYARGVVPACGGAPQHHGPLPGWAARTGLCRGHQVPASGPLRPADRGCLTLCPAHRRARHRARAECSERRQ